MRACKQINQNAISRRAAVYIHLNAMHLTEKIARVLSTYASCTCDISAACAAVNFSFFFSLSAITKLRRVEYYFKNGYERTRLMKKKKIKK